MTKKPRRSLMDVMKERRYAEGCVLCDLPEELRNEVEQGKRDGAALRDIVTYLVEYHGYDKDRLERQRKTTVMTQHFSRHAVLRKAPRAK